MTYASGSIAQASDRFRKLDCAAAFGRYVSLYITAIMHSAQLCAVGRGRLRLPPCGKRQAHFLVFA